MPIRFLLAAFALSTLATPGAAQRHATPAPAPLISLTGEFERFADATVAVPDADRLAQFKARFAALFPGFYTPRGRDPVKYDAQLLAALRGFPAIRGKYDAAAAGFATAFAGASTRYRRFFPDFRVTIPVYLVHSLGEMDGGTREIAGKTVAVFGADVIAQIHDATTIGPFLDHELFHIYHARFFPDCDALWCSLWEEGLAVYVASQLNPGSNDRQLLLTIPRPIRPEVDAHLADAICLTRAKLDSNESADYQQFFQFGNATSASFPPRFGYYVGYRIAQKLGETHSLQALARLSPGQVHPLMLAAMKELAPGCG
jgi:hypothetical protein